MCEFFVCFIVSTAQHRPVPPHRNRRDTHEARHARPGWTINQGDGQVRTNRPAKQTRLADSHAPGSRSGLGHADHHRGWVTRVRLTDVLVIRTVGMIPRSTILARAPRTATRRHARAPQSNTLICTLHATTNTLAKVGHTPPRSCPTTCLTRPNHAL